jgi:hypothetical protein
VGNQIIKQPDGKFAVLNSNTDTIVLWDATKDEVVDWFVQIELAALEQRKQSIAGMVDQVAADNAREVYHQFAMTWDEALERDREHDGEAWREYRRG